MLSLKYYDLVLKKPLKLCYLYTYTKLGGQTAVKNLTFLLLLLLPLVAFTSSGCDNESNAQETSVEAEILAVDFLQNIISGSIGEKISQNEYAVELELSPNTIYTSDIPRRTAGSITTESFYNNFNLNFPELFPNAILSMNEGDVVTAITFEMKNPAFDPLTGILELTISPLNTDTDAGESSINLIEIDDITSPFGQSSLFIDDASNTCQGLAQGTCSIGNNIDASCGGSICCFIDGECSNPEAVCTGGSVGICSVTGEVCLDDSCCTSGLGCLTTVPIDIGL